MAETAAENVADAPARDRPYVFISYASVDRDRVLSLEREVRESGIPTWVDQADITGGVSYGPEITTGIKGCRALLLMCSAASLASRNVVQEIQLAWRFDRPILPLLLEPVSFPENLVYWLEGAQWIETFGDGHHDWLRRLRQALAQRGYPTTSEPERPLVVESEGGGQEMPPTNLPPTADALVGRDRELRQLQALAANGRLITITGTGGVGKTRLALEFGRRAAPAHPGGVWFVSASEDRTPAELEMTIQATLGVSDERDEPSIEAVARYLAESTALLILDNLEQIPGAAATVATLLERAPALTVLCTSRSPLRVPAEIVLPVAGLETLDTSAAQSALAVSKNPAAALFVARAKVARADFVLTDGNAGAVAAVCAHLDGLPLAIELAAARARLLPPAAILERLRLSLDLLSRGASLRSDRQQTLRSTIAWSYDLLEPPAQRAFRRLAAFAGGCTIDAAESVLGDGEALDLLDELIDQSLLVADRPSVDTDEPRIRMLETIREFAAEQLGGSGDDTVARDAHAAWYLAMAEAAESDLEGGADAGVLDRLETDHVNLRAALRWLATAPDDDRAVNDLRLASALWRFWWMRGHLQEGLAALQDVVARRTGASAAARARAMVSAAVLAESCGRLGPAAALLDEAIALARSAHDEQVLARAIDGRGTVAEARGDYPLAIERYQEALALYRALDHERGIAVTLHHLASAATLQGSYDAAKSYASEALDVWRRRGELQAISFTLQQLGILTFLDGDYDQAIGTYQECAAIAETLDDRVGLGNALLNLGSAMEMAGDLPGAKGTLRRSLTILAGIGDEGGVGYVEYLLGHVARAEGVTDVARQHLSGSLETLAGVGDRASVALVLETLAGVEHDLGNSEQSARLFGAAERERSETGAALPASRRDEVARDIAALRVAIPEDQLERAWAEGRSLAIDRLIGTRVPTKISP